MSTLAYQRGIRAQQSNHPEPDCPYEPGSNDYREFAEGFCKGAPTLNNDAHIVAENIQTVSTTA